MTSYSTKYRKPYVQSALARLIECGLTEKELLTSLKGIGYKNPQVYLFERGVEFPKRVELKHG